LEDNKVKIVYEKSHNLSKEKDINNNFNNFDETKENIDLNQSKSMNNELVKKTNKTIYLKSNMLYLYLYNYYFCYSIICISINISISVSISISINISIIEIYN